jgi:GH15 family glucan-1,4-alpha-glucosidase
MRRPARIDGYPLIADLAAIGDRRTAALVALDGAIEWMCLPAFDGSPVFGRLLDPARGGESTLAPTEDFEAERRYVPHTNVLQTTFRTATGVARVTDTLTWSPADAHVEAELVRRIEGVSGEIGMRWTVAPRASYERTFSAVGLGIHHILRDGDDVLTVQAWDAGDPHPTDGAITGAFTCSQGARAAIAVRAFLNEPIVVDPRNAIERRLDHTIARWQAWAARCEYEGQWRDAVERSVLVLGLLTHEPSGAMVAAPTTSLPERIGGDRNYDYRFSWVRDTNLAADALLRVGYRDDVHSSLRWLMRAAARTHPRLRPLYTLDTSPGRPPHELDVDGYRRTSPVLVGNGASDQLQLGTYGDLFTTAWLWVRDGHHLDRASARLLAESADSLTRMWHRPDSGFWELPAERHYTQSKIATWDALHNAVRLAELGHIPSGTVARWRSTERDMRAFIETRCWSNDRARYLEAADVDGLDAALLLTSRTGFHASDTERLRATIAAVRAMLGAGGPLLYRTSRLREREGAFVACSFWLVEALARIGDVDDASALMHDLVGYANDVGLFSEEIDPGSHAFLGNTPQALSHIALINAALQVDEAAEGRLESPAAQPTSP